MDGPTTHEGLNQDGYVVRQPAHDKRQHHGDDDADGLVPLLIPGVAQRHQGPAVANCHHQQRQEEAHGVAQDPDAHTPVVAAFPGEVFVADGLAQVGSVHALLLNQHG